MFCEVNKCVAPNNWNAFRRAECIQHISLILQNKKQSAYFENTSLLNSFLIACRPTDPTKCLGYCIFWFFGNTTFGIPRSKNPHEKYREPGGSGQREEITFSTSKTSEIYTWPHKGGCIVWPPRDDHREHSRFRIVHPPKNAAPLKKMRFRAGVLSTFFHLEIQLLYLRGNQPTLVSAMASFQQQALCQSSKRGRLLSKHLLMSQVPTKQRNNESKSQRTILFWQVDGYCSAGS